MTDMKFELRGRCPKCKTERTIWGYVLDNPTPAALDAMENRMDQRGSVKAHCPKCDAIEEVAFFDNGKQTEPWLDANEYERRFGRKAGPLPPRAWRPED